MVLQCILGNVTKMKLPHNVNKNVHRTLNNMRQAQPI